MSHTDQRLGILINIVAAIPPVNETALDLPFNQPLTATVVEPRISRIGNERRYLRKECGYAFAGGDGRANHKIKAMKAL